MTLVNPLDAAFIRGKHESRALLIPYLTAGFPDPESFVDLAVGVLEAGADALEVGVPFSDPLLDGPTIQQAQHQALQAGVTPRQCLDFCRQIGDRVDRPLLLMGAYNPFLAQGLETYCRQAAELGVTGLIIPDLPWEEQRELRRITDGVGLHLIQLLAPTSSPERRAKVCASATGFIYCVSVAGVTGAREALGDQARELAQDVRARTATPVAVGFGISNARLAEEAASYADAVIVGSALTDVIQKAPQAETQERAASFARELAAAVSIPA